MLQAVDYSTTTTNKSRAYSACKLKYIYGVEGEQNKHNKILYFPHCRVNIGYLVLLPVPEEHILHFPSRSEWLFASGNMTVSSRGWLSENYFRRVLVDGYTFH